jgi:broad specificity phosphatase PhoE
MKTTLYLIRQANATAALCDDPPLTRLGVRQAEMTRDFLAVRPIDRCYCSTRQRALQTASIIAAPHGLTPHGLEALDEGDFDLREGFADMQSRVAEALEDILERHAGAGVLVVAHRLIHLSYLAGVLRLSSEQATRVALDSCGISLVVRDGCQSTVTTLNASFHLQGLAA